MKLKELNTPFEKKRMLAYGRDGNTAVRRYIEVQRITGNLYKSRTEIVGWGYEQCRLYLFFPGCPAGLDLGHLSFFGERTVEDMEQDYTANGWTSGAFIETTDRQAADAAASAIPRSEFARLVAKSENTPRSANPVWMSWRTGARWKLQNGWKNEKSRRNGPNRKKKKEKPPCSAGDTMPELQLNRRLPCCQSNTATTVL
ncbi:MAG: hypothetical protein ACLVHV_03420 [Oscillospiraceae bacterium]